ncbi:unnamed protein product, partial [Porites evermanni]
KVCKFLRERGLEDEVIEKVKEEKMNETAISLASDKSLKELGIVAKGDILSLRAFVNRKINDTESFDGVSREQRKRMLIEKLLDGRKKFGGSDSSSFKGKKTKVTKESVKQIKTRKVKLAWQHFNDDSRRYVMVREATGGGQREMSLPCDSDYSEVLSILTDLFFPNGKSSRGQVSEMELCLGSFKCEVIDKEGFTVGDYISVNKLTKPRLYLLSKAKSHAEDQENSTDSMDNDVLFRPVLSSTPVQDVHSPHVKDTCNLSDDEVVFKGHGFHEDEGSLLLGKTLVDVTEGDDVQHSFRVKEELPVSLLKTGDGGSIKCPVCRIDFTEIQSGSSLEPAGDEILEDVQNIFTRKMEALDKLCDQGESRNVKIDRANIVQDMLQLYKDKGVAEGLLNVNFCNEPALDMDGVKREAFTLFWEKVMPLYFDGTTTYVPRISPSIDESVYVTLGRILSHGFVMVGVFPTMINEVFFSILMAGNENVRDDDFLEGFLEFVSCYESLRLRQILEECGSHNLLDPSTNFLVDFLSDFGVTKMPNVNNLKAILVSVAKTELWNKAVMAANAMKQGLLEGVYRDLWLPASSELVSDLYRSLQVTTEKVLSLITVDETSAMTKGQEVVFTYLRKYVRTLNEKELPCFLHYVTGSSALSVTSMKVIFHAHVGNLPHITVHACSSVIDLPSGGYESFTDFRCQMDEVLKNAESWKFSLI